MPHSSRGRVQVAVLDAQVPCLFSQTAGCGHFFGISEKSQIRPVGRYRFRRRRFPSSSRMLNFLS